MGQYVNDGKIDLGSQYDLDDAVAEIGDLIGVGARTSGTYSGKRVMADLFVASGINKWAKNRPIPYDKEFGLTEEERKSANYGYSFIRVMAWNEDLINGYQEWQEGVLTKYRIKDFDGYNHNAQPPIQFCFEDGSKTKMMNTTFGIDLPDVVVLLRKNASVGSSALNADIGVEDVSVTYPSGVSLAGFLPCVIAYKDDVGYRCANGSKKIGDVTASDVDNLRIALSAFNIGDAFRTGVSLDEIEGEVPSGATNYEMMELHPRLNNYTDLDSRRLYSVDDSTPFGDLADSTQVYGNGFIRQLTTAIAPPPDGSPLKIVRFEINVAKLDYIYASVRVDGSSFVGTWLYDYTTNAESTALKVATLGGKTIPFSSKEVVVMINVTIYNVYNKTIYARPTRMDFGPTNVSTTDVYAYNLDYITIPAGGSATAQIYGTFPAGSGSDYTFKEYTSPSAGYTNATVYFEFGEVTDKYGSAMLVPNYGSQKFLAWR